VGATNDFRVTNFSISSYSDQHSMDSLLAHGVLDNVVLTVPPPPVGILTGGFSGTAWQVQFSSRRDWVYVLERSTNLQTWAGASSPTPGNGASLTLPDVNPPVENAAYRVRAQRP